MKFDRTDEGHQKALAGAARLAKMHPDKKYALLVDRSSPDKYSYGLASLIRKDDVEPGTVAHLVDADGKMTPLFPEEDA